MIGEVVVHPRYGRGQLVAVYRNGAEWLVQFEHGLRFRRPRAEFDGQSAAPRPRAPIPIPSAPMSRTQFEARQLVEALRVGVAPAQHVRAVTVGLADERDNLVAGLSQAHQSGGAARAVLGEYGFGKSHVVELCAQEALARGFLVAATSLDLIELPPHRAFDIYGGLARSLRYPGSEERGLAPLLDAALAAPRLTQQLRELSPVGSDPLVVTLEVLEGTPSLRQRKVWRQWLEGGNRVPAMTKSLPRGVKLPGIYRVGENARQMAYLLSGLSALARLANFSGLCVLIDEAESYALLRARDRPKASLFFQALIYASLGEGQPHIPADALPQHRYQAYPPAYGQGQALFFLFTSTYSEDQLPVEAWLDPDEILELDPHHTPQEIGQFLKQLQAYHAQAYGYEPDARQGQISRGAAEHLAHGMRHDRLSIRGVVRLAVELFDLLYLYPEYDAATLLEELRGQMR